jgi:uncharacterized protein YjbI with pentapeptide repeats
MTTALVGLGTVSGLPGSAIASADTVVSGCTIVANPTATHFTDCPGVDFSTADLSGVDLSYADLVGASFASCTESAQPPSITCTGTDLEHADLHDADASAAAFSAKVLGTPSIYVFATADLAGATLTGLDAAHADLQQVSLTDDDLTGADLSGADLSLVNTASDVGSDLRGATLVDVNASGADLLWADLTDSTWTGADLASATLTDAVLTGASFTGADLQSAELSGTVLIPPDQAAQVPSASGGVVTWSTPASLPGATPGACTPPSGATFPVGQTQVTCAVGDDGGHQAHGTFTLDVTVRPAITISMTSLPPATVGVPYSTTLSASGGNPPYTWKLVPNEGKPPSGIKLDRATGMLSGTPTKKAATTTFTVEVLDTKTTRTKGHPATRNTATGQFTISVSP